MGFASEEGEEGEPAWFPLFEMGGAMIGVAVSMMLFQIYDATKGGLLSAGIAWMLGAVVCITLAVGLHGINEIVEFVDEFTSEVVFELLIYISMILIGIGARRLVKIA